MRPCFLICLFALFFFGCRNEPRQINTINLESLEDVLPAIHSKKELVTFLTAHPQLRDYFFGRRNYPNDSVFINELFRRFTNPSIDTLLAETHRVFGDKRWLQDEFGVAFANLKKHYPDVRVPKIQTVISGLETDLFVSDSLIVIGLDYYLGAGAKYRPNMYDYMLRRYNKGFIVPSVLLIMGIDTHFNKTSTSDRTALADMIAYGKAYYFASQMQPSVPDSVLIGYTSEEMSSVTANEDLIYAHLIDKGVLYATDHLMKQKYLADRPHTPEISEKCPGRIATWIGWQIVKSYASRHSDKSVPDIMKVTSAEQFLKDSKYRPLKK